MQPISDPHDTSRVEGLDGATVISIVYATSIAIVMLNLAPTVEAYLRQDAHLSSGQVGAVFFIELAAMGLASFPAYAWLGRIDSVQVARCAYAVFMLGSVLSSFHLASFAHYAAARAITGAGSGTLMVLGMSTAARARNPDRMYALITFAQLGSGAVLLYLFSALAGGGRGLKDVFIASACLGALGLFAAGSLARSDRRESRPPRAAALPRSIGWRTTLLAIVFAMAFNLVVGGMWTFVAEYAAAGTTPAQVALVLTGATAAGLVGAASAFVIGDRWPRRRLLIAGYLGILLGSGLLEFARGPVGFTAGCSVLSLAWNFTVPYVFAAVAGQDRTGRLMSAANLAFAFGLALGPLFAGGVIESLGLDALFPCALAFLALGAVLAVRITRPLRT